MGTASDRMSFYGQGAGRYPTAYNVVQDCVDILSGKGFYTPYGEKVCAVNSDLYCYYIRGGKDLPAAVKETWNGAVVTEPTSVAAMHAWRKKNPNAFIAALV